MATNDRETWRTLRRELEDVGISPTVINEKRRFIVDWFQQAVAAGQLDEDCDESDHGSYDGGSSIDDEDTTSNSAIEHALQNTEAGPANIDAQTFTRKQDSDRESSYKPLKKKSPLMISYFLGKLRFQETRLIRAAKDGNITTIQKLIDRGADINAKNENGWTALFYAAVTGHEMVVRLLLDRGADINAEDKEGWTALSWADARGYKTVVRLLLNIEADRRMSEEKKVLQLLETGELVHSGQELEPSLDFGPSIGI